MCSYYQILLFSIAIKIVKPIKEKGFFLSNLVLFAG